MKTNKICLLEKNKEITAVFNVYLQNFHLLCTLKTFECCEVVFLKYIHTVLSTDTVYIHKIYSYSFKSSIFLSR